MVVGGDWLKTFVVIELYYLQMRLEVLINSKKVYFNAITKRGECKLLLGKSMHKLLKGGPITTLGHILLVTTKVKVDTPGVVQEVLRNTKTFAEPKGLPPRRAIEHQIILNPDAIPRKHVPYMYSHAFKNEIENIIKEILESGVIQNSTRAFASPVLLVKKKDGS